MKKIRIESLLLIIVLLLVILFFIRLKLNNNPIKSNIENISFVRGTDVSRYQGDVDFDKLYNQSIRFVFIKATEGLDHVDPNFQINWEKASNTKMKVGAYHFFRFETDAKEQAQNFINNVKLEDKNLPPVIDLEYYGKYINSPVTGKVVKEELKIMIDAFREHFNKRPIIYCNKYVYDRYVKGNNFDVDIWYRSIDTGFPTLPDKKAWMFWQYDDKAVLEGYGGPGASEFIDLNYFYGSVEELEEYGRNK